MTDWVKAYTEVRVNLTHYKVPAVIHMVQDDTARSIRVYVEDNDEFDENLYTYEFSMICTRPDGTAYSYTGQLVGVIDPYINFDISEHGGALSQAGIVNAQVLITVDDETIASFAFRIIVEAKVGGPATQEDITFVAGLQAQVDSALAEIDSRLENIPAANVKIDANTTLPAWIGDVKGMKDIAISSNSSQAFTIGNGSRVFLFCTGLANGLNGIYAICANTSGAVSAYTLVSASSITLTTGMNALSIANGAGSNARVLAIVSTGSMDAA